MPMYRVRTLWTGVDGSPFYSNLYFTQEGGTAAQARIATVNLWVALDELITTNLQFTVEAEVPIIDEVTGDVLSVQVDSTLLQNTGQEVASPLPYSNQYLIRSRTGAFNGSREIRGRIFVPGATVDQASDGEVSPTALAVLQVGASALVNEANAQWVTWAKSKGTYAVNNSASPWNQFAVLRSRRD